MNNINNFKIFELFAGIGAPRMALENMKVDYVSLGYSEIDKHAIAAYCELYNDTPENNWGDITQIKELPNNIDLLFHGSPCQDFSVAGRNAGGDIGSETRSSLMWETVRLIEQARPNIVIWENVKGVLNKNNVHNFEKYLEQLEKLGYENKYEVINAVNFVPQNRERIFVVSIKKDNEYNFEFPNIEKKDYDINDYIDFENIDYYEKQGHYKWLFEHADKKTDFGVYALISQNFLKDRKQTTNNKFTGTILAGRDRWFKYNKGGFGFLEAKECLALMGFPDIHNISIAQKHKVAGNTIVVPVVEHIYKGLKKIEIEMLKITAKVGDIYEYNF